MLYSWGMISQQWPHSDSASFSSAQNSRHGGNYTVECTVNTHYGKTPPTAQTTHTDTQKWMWHTNTNTHTSGLSSPLPPETTLHAWLPAVKTLKREHPPPDILLLILIHLSLRLWSSNIYKELRGRFEETRMLVCTQLDNQSTITALSLAPFVEK